MPFMIEFLGVRDTRREEVGPTKKVKEEPLLRPSVRVSVAASLE